VADMPATINECSWNHDSCYLKHATFESDTGKSCAINDISSRNVEHSQCMTGITSNSNGCNCNCVVDSDTGNILGRNKLKNIDESLSEVQSVKSVTSSRNACLSVRVDCYQSQQNFVNSITDKSTPEVASLSSDACCPSLDSLTMATAGPLFVENDCGALVKASGGTCTEQSCGAETGLNVSFGNGDEGCVQQTVMHSNSSLSVEVKYFSKEAAVERECSERRDADLMGEQTPHAAGACCCDCGDQTCVDCAAHASDLPATCADDIQTAIGQSDLNDAQTAAGQSDTDNMQTTVNPSGACADDMQNSVGSPCGEHMQNGECADDMQESCGLPGADDMQADVDQLYAENMQVNIECGDLKMNIVEMPNTSLLGQSPNQQVAAEQPSADRLVAHNVTPTGSIGAETVVNNFDEAVKDVDMHVDNPGFHVSAVVNRSLVEADTSMTVCEVASDTQLAKPSSSCFTFRASEHVESRVGPMSIENSSEAGACCSCTLILPSATASTAPSCWCCWLSVFST
jgi:hypothetical protein